MGSASGTNVLLTPFDGGGWRVRLRDGDTVLVVAGGVGLDSNPLIFSGELSRGDTRDEMPMVVVSAPDVRDVIWTHRIPLQVRSAPGHPEIVSSHMPLWDLVLRGGSRFHVRADAMRRHGRWHMFSFRVIRNEREADEPVLFVRANSLVQLSCST